LKTNKIAALSVLAALAAGCAAVTSRDEDYSAKAVQLMKASFQEKGQAKLDRLDQDEVQRVCSEYHGDVKVPKDIAEKIEKSQLETIKYPAGGLLGDWKQGERIAQSGVGMQFSDDPKVPAGANCYACHNLPSQDFSSGTIAPPPN